MANSQFTRRCFVGCCASAAAAVAMGQTEDKLSSTSPEKRLYDPPSPEEEANFEESPMVQQIMNVNGCSCAESAFLAALRCLDLPEDHVHAAAAFGGGLGQGDLCGYLTGGFMALGAAAGAHHKDRKKMKTRSGEMTREFWNWWNTLAPIHCHDLKQQYDRDGYVNMRKRVAAKVEELIQADAKLAEEADA